MRCVERHAGRGVLSLARMQRRTGVNGAGTPDPGAAFEVIVRDLANNPIAGAHVIVDFSQCDDLRISHQSSGLVNPALAGQVLDCATATVRGVTNSQGRVQMSVLGAGLTYAGGPESGPGEHCAISRSGCAASASAPPGAARSARASARGWQHCSSPDNLQGGPR